MPIGLRVSEGEIEIEFSDPLEKMSPQLLRDSIIVRTWALKRTANYGSAHYDKKQIEVAGANLSAQGRILRLKIPDLEPVWQMSIKYFLKGANGEPVEGEIQNTIHEIGRNR